MRSSPPDQTCIARLSCTDDDAQGQTLKVFWDYELDRLILEEEGWADLAIKGFRPAAPFRGVFAYAAVELPIPIYFRRRSGQG
jgi:hypothetical protein